MALHCIVAYSNNRVIGQNNQLPWHISADLKYFKQVTMGKPVIMGRKTWDSIGRPLPGRRNIVITRQLDWQADGAETAYSIEQAIARLQPDEDAFVIGGEQIFRQALDYCKSIYATEVDVTIPDGDAFFPPLPPQWHKVSTSPMQTENQFRFTFVHYEKS